MGGGDSLLYVVSTVSKLSMCPIVFKSDLCYFCLVKAGYERGSWIGAFRDQNTHADNRRTYPCAMAEGTYFTFVL